MLNPRHFLGPADIYFVRDGDKVAFFLPRVNCSCDSLTRIVGCVTHRLGQGQTVRIREINLRELTRLRASCGGFRSSSVTDCLRYWGVAWDRVPSAVKECVT